MDVAKRGCQPIEAVTTLGCAPYSLSLILAGGRGWRHYFPGKRNSMLRIGSEQGVQKSGAAPRQTHNKERFANFLPPNAGIKLSISFQKQTRAQCAQEIGAESNSSDQIKPRFALAGFE
jgi:hypothetical protein